ncbi:F-actin-monooxygenase MICAL2 isoform X2 [Pantherophis guttatus]|uniref:F-actin-monooxygenase MICAL2 isoform X2 n=1 Tax=Pantherophis guttatus TaxID=94885 RepID=A0ABM3Z5K4_PANGU|nr:F-actin-monooxygenase MICAL2 isoform X2 [Pantherophis guttatus]
MGEKDNDKYNQANQIFESFVQAQTCKGSIQAFNILTRHLELDPLDNRNFYVKLKSKVTSWKAKALWNKLDKRASHKEYKRGKSCTNTKCLIVGGGPCGLRTAIELAFLGAKVVVVEKRDTFSRNNVLHLWPFTIHDLRSLGAKKFYGKFCAGSIDHISIRQLQLTLFKIALLLGVEIHVNLEFVKVLEPPEDQENQKIGWRAEFFPMDHPLSEFEFDVIIGADGRRNSLEGFKRKEFRGKLAIAITANFINKNTTAEAKVEEISGVAFIFNQKFFQDLKEETGIDLENIVYYKDSTHYFVMTAKKQSLLDKGVIINDFIDTEMLLCVENVDQDNLLSYAREAADFATDYQLPALDFAINHYGQPDVAMFDFTSMYASENAALVRERHRHQLLVALVGDSLVEPFWPMGTGCARGFLAAFDTAWMVKSWAQGKFPLDILAERESIYRLLPQTTPENITKNFDQYTIDPATRYPNLNSSCVRPHQVKHLYITNELQPCLLERANTIRRSIGLSKREYDIRPNKLLTWCQKQTEGYKNVNVTDLTSSWKSGLALCALIHRFKPDLIDFDSLNEEDAVENNQLAFDIAEREFEIPPVTTGKEMVSAGEPDKLSMVMYLSKFYELFRGTPLRAVGTMVKQNGEIIDPSSTKSSKFGCNNYINLTFPRKRIPKVEENETSKRRRKSFISFEESSNYFNQERNSSNRPRDMKGTINRNKVKSMATQLLAKFEENAPNVSLRRQGSLKREFPQTIGGSETCYFCKKRVYVMEQLSAEGHFFHRECFKCVICATTLRLATYTFDAQEGNFYCKLHFAQCKTKNTHRKKKVEIKEEAGFQRHQEPMCEETSSESAFATSSSSEDQSPEYYNCPVDDSMSLKKCKNISHLDLRSSLASSEWTLVKVTPEEEKAHHKPLAVQVVVTSDGSSSDLESDVFGNSAILASSEEMLPLPKPIWNCLPSSKRSPLVTTNLEKGNDRLEKSKAANALQRAYSLRDSSSSKKYQNWKKKIQSNFPLSYNKISGPSSKDASASLQQDFEESCFKTELTYPNNIPETKAHFQPHTTEFHCKEKSTNEPGQIPFYVPHFCCVDSYPVAPSESLSHADWATIPSSLKPGINHCGTDEQYLGNEAVNSQQLTSRLFTKNSDTSSVNLDEGDKIASAPAREQQGKPLNKAKSKIMRKLTRALKNSQPEGTRIAHQGQGIPGPKNPYFSQDEHIPKQPSYARSPEFSDNLLPVWDPEQQFPKYVDKCPIAAQPKLSLKLMANVIRKSILEGLEKSQDVHNKLSLENTFNFSHNLAHPENLKNTRYQENSSAQMQELFMLNPTEQGLEPRSSVISNFPGSIEDIRYDDRSSYFPKYDVHLTSSRGTHHGHSYSNKVDVPTLLERFTLKENTRKSYIHCNEKNMLHPSLRHKKKSDNAILDGPVQRNNVWNLFSNLRNNEDDSIKSPLLMPAVSPTTIFDVDKVLSDSSKGEYLGSKGLPAKKQATTGYYSSSSDDEWECKPSPQLLVKNTLRRNKKLAKETKQLVKQKELKRLHKAQAIQRLLEEVEEKQRALEVYGVQLERELRGEAESSTQDESELLHEWFELVLEKNRLTRYEAELLTIAKEIELEDRQNDWRRTEIEN